MRPLLSALLCALAIAGCSSESDDDGSGGGATGANCGGKGETFTANMSKPGREGELTFVLVSSDPAPPQKFENVWVIEVREGDVPLAGAMVVADTLMVDHGHSGEPAPTVTDLRNGRYELDPVNLGMKGLWDVTISATSAGGTADSTTFKFCIEG